MGLNKSELETKVREAFQRAKNTKTPDDPADISALQEQINAQLAKDLADAIDAYVHGGEVVNIEMDITVEPGDVLDEITITQRGVGSVQ